MNTTTTHIEELDLALADMDLPETEKRAQAALKSLSGILKVRIIERGCWVEYDSHLTHPETICKALEKAGLKAAIFQDSGSGEEGSVNF
ncbi:hypothetical protein WJU23_18080 [Prosthecobacter sp. SYSU 5D2]|uniref:hypothetical protein n=1 Tax=Prosthecobacter sp. SYSU 5D2 TaxID=3134134 RepID=UPI0031FEFF4F